METDPERDVTPAEAERRAALKKMAVFGAYTAPFMLGVLTASKAVAQSGGGGRGCCSVDAYLASGQSVGQATVGSPLKMMAPDGSATYDGAVERMRQWQEQPCLRFRTTSGIALTLSESTPIAVRRGTAVEYLLAADVVAGDVLPVEDDGGFRWESLSGIEDRGPLPVALLSANDGVYAAGDVPGRMIYTHNYAAKN